VNGIPRATSLEAVLASIDSSLFEADEGVNVIDGLLLCLGASGPAEPQKELMR